MYMGTLPACRLSMQCDALLMQAALDLKTAPLAKGYDVVCLFVNDNADEKVSSRQCAQALLFPAVARGLM